MSKNKMKMKVRVKFRNPHVVAVIYNFNQDHFIYTGRVSACNENIVVMVLMLFSVTFISITVLMRFYVHKRECLAALLNSIRQGLNIPML